MTTSLIYTHAIIYVGSPYGEDESGHIVSRHKSLKNAEKTFNNKFSGTTGIYNNKIVELDGNGNWER